jgi:hypothetical protein
MSPDVIPTSPRQGYSNKISMGKAGYNQNRSSNGTFYAGNKDAESSLYTTNNSVNGTNGMNATAKRGFESQ